MICPYFKQCPAFTKEECPPCLEDNYYIVQAGDTLYTIARLYNISPDDLIEANLNLEPDLILPGQIIKIPLIILPINCPTGASTYTIQKADTFYSIARKFKMRLSALLKANPNINPDALLIGQSICIPAISKSYINETYRIKFIHPFRWSKINNIRYEGIDGFFQVSAVSGSATLEEICRNEAYHKLKPYGAQPAISKIKAGGREACFIIPSSDQTMEMHNQSSLVVAYDKPIEIEGTSYEYLIIWVDKSHLRDIADTLEFL